MVKLPLDSNRSYRSKTGAQPFDSWIERFFCIYIVYTLKIIGKYTCIILIRVYFNYIKKHNLKEPRYEKNNNHANVNCNKFKRPG